MRKKDQKESERQKFGGRKREEEMWTMTRIRKLGVEGVEGGREGKGRRERRGRTGSRIWREKRGRRGREGERRGNYLSLQSDETLLLFVGGFNMPEANGGVERSGYDIVFLGRMPKCRLEKGERNGGRRREEEGDAMQCGRTVILAM